MFSNFNAGCSLFEAEGYSFSLKTLQRSRGIKIWHKKIP
jgi:hypothetical protein